MAKFINEEGLTFDDVLLLPRYSLGESRRNVKLITKLTNNFNILTPIISANMDSITTSDTMISMANLGGVGVLHRFMPLSDIRFHVERFREATKSNKFYSPTCVSIGVGPESTELLNLYKELKVDIIVIDIAHGWSKKVKDLIKKIKDFIGCNVIAGNVATYDAAIDLYEAGANAIKVGVGPGCFAAGTRILMANGIYKNIEDIKPGDRVINKYGYPINVKKSFKTGYRKVSKLNNSLFYKDTLVTKDHNYWVGDFSTTSLSTISSYLKLLAKKSKTIPKTSKIKWMEIGKLDRGCMLMPKNINFELANTFKEKIYKRCGGHYKAGFKYKIDVILEPSYDLGYIFGTFLGDGSSSIAVYKKSERGAVRWFFGAKEEDIANKLIASIKNVFNKDATITKEDNTTVVNFYYKPLANYLWKFGKRKDKFLPEHLLVNNIEYLRGIMHGLIDSDGHYSKDRRFSFSNTSKRLIELFNVIFYIIEGYFPNNEENPLSTGGLKNCDINNCNPSYRSRSLIRPEYRQNNYNQVAKILSYEDTNLYLDVYDIEVDCPTHSFIAENAIVHNSVCSTRIRTGCGNPQLSAIIECSVIPCPIIADGGIKNGGDVIKSLAAGASSCMIGNLISGCTECPGEIIEMEGKKYKKYRGQASFDFQKEWKGIDKQVNIEGESKLVEIKGSIEDVVNELLSGVRSGFSYCGANDIEELRKNAIFRRVSSNTLIENRPHGKSG